MPFELTSAVDIFFTVNSCKRLGIRLIRSNFAITKFLILFIMKNDILSSALVETIDSIVSERFRAMSTELDERVRKAVEEVTHPTPLMSRAEVAEYLHCSLVTVHAMMKDGRLGYTKIGASTKFDRAEVERLAKSSRRAGL